MDGEKTCQRCGRPHGGRTAICFVCNYDRPVSELTKREHFAGLALQGMLASSQWNSGNFDNAELAAPVAVAFADSLIRFLDVVET